MLKKRKENDKKKGCVLHSSPWHNYFGHAFLKKISLLASASCSMALFPALEIRSQLFSLLFDLRVHKPPSVNVPPPTPKTGKDFPSDINPINAWLSPMASSGYGPRLPAGGEIKGHMLG